ncbi:hypothetical protein TruAng_007694 [Truncatella angustata]|nr:hypothetical protein TruAng_007694 [Truncatella angustata]
MSSEPERSNRTAAYFDYQMGRRPSQAPAHLSRVLYIPRHYDNTVHLPIYEVGHRYRDAVQGCLLGSTVYTTTLGSMETPHGDRMEDQAVYLADIRRSEEEDVEIHLCKRELASRGEHVDLNMTSNSFDDTSAVTIKSGEGPMKMSTSFPIANSTRGRKSIKHPYFALTGLNTTTEKPGEHVPYSKRVAQAY